MHRFTSQEVVAAAVSEPKYMTILYAACRADGFIGEDAPAFSEDAKSLHRLNDVLQKATMALQDTWQKREARRQAIA